MKPTEFELIQQEIMQYMLGACPRMPYNMNINSKTHRNN